MADEGQRTSLRGLAAVIGDRGVGTRLNEQIGALEGACHDLNHDLVLHSAEKGAFWVMTDKGIVEAAAADVARPPAMPSCQSRLKPSEVRWRMLANGEMLSYDEAASLLRLPPGDMEVVTVGQAYARACEDVGRDPSAKTTWER